MLKADKNQTRVLVVEDDPDINQLISYNLRKEGFLIDQVYDGSLAKKILLDRQFDIVILDIMLPGVDGFDICKEFKEKAEFFKTFFVIISAKSRNQDKLYAHILGADCYFTKPIDLKALMETVREIREMQNKEFIVTAK